MPRLLATLVLVASSSALATGERVAFVPEDSPLKGPVCLSMLCDGGPPEATVRTRSVRGGLEVSVTLPSGQRRLTTLAPTRPDGTLGSTDLVRVATLVLRAIEAPAPAPLPPSRARASSLRVRGKIVARR
jgi:hypothetical protein